MFFLWLKLEFLRMPNFVENIGGRGRPVWPVSTGWLQDITRKTAKSAMKDAIPQEKAVFQPSLCTGDDLEVPQF